MRLSTKREREVAAAATPPSPLPGFPARAGHGLVSGLRRDIAGLGEVAVGGGCSHAVQRPYYGPVALGKPERGLPVDSGALKGFIQLSRPPEEAGFQRALLCLAGWKLLLGPEEPHFGVFVLCVNFCS